MMPNYDIAELCYGCFKLPILRAALRSSGGSGPKMMLLAVKRGSRKVGPRGPSVRFWEMTPRGRVAFTVASPGVNRKRSADIDLEAAGNQSYGQAAPD
jgi:hypothetical protein